MDDYCQLLSTIFSDHYLSDDLILTDPERVRFASACLDRLELPHHLRIADGRFSTTDLSAGQRKRLGLIHAYLDQRPIMMLDEWAADQNSTFRRIYDTELIPEFKSLGRTLIIVSHDDRYFTAAGSSRPAFRCPVQGLRKLAHRWIRSWMSMGETRLHSSAMLSIVTTSRPAAIRFRAHDRA